MFKRITIAIITVLIVIISGCSAKDQQSSSTAQKNTDTTVAPTENQNFEDVMIESIGFTYDSYKADSGSFKEAVYNNNIDKKYKEDVDAQDLTMQDYLQIEEKYEKIWRDEMHSSLESFSSELDEEDATSFKLSITKWEESADTMLSVENNIINTEKYRESSYSSAVTAQLLNFHSKSLKMFREKTIEIKFLHYILESVKNNDEENFKSIQFNQCQ